MTWRGIYTAYPEYATLEFKSVQREGDAKAEEVEIVSEAQAVALAQFPSYFRGVARIYSYADSAVHLNQETADTFPIASYENQRAARRAALDAAHAIGEPELEKYKMTEEEQAAYAEMVAAQRKAAGGRMSVDEAIAAGRRGDSA